MKKVMAININDLGGISDHLMDHKYHNCNRNYIDWKYWAEQVDKSATWNAFKDYILKKKPDILVIQEMLVSRYENIDFISELDDLGYTYLKGCLPENDGNYSLTITFYNRDCDAPEYLNFPNDSRRYRSVVSKLGNLIICGSHFPPESDLVFLKRMYQFVLSYQDKNFLLIGDLNASNPTMGNWQLISNLLKKGFIDLWTAAGNDEHTPTEAQYGGRLDLAIASPSLAKKVEHIEIDSTPMKYGITDHSAVIVDIKD